jgi:hypothetical protein
MSAKPDLFSPGDHVLVTRGWYSHHGIYAGRGMVIHLSGEVKKKKSRDARVRQDSLEDFAQGAPVMGVEDEACFPGPEIVSRARARLGEQGYSALWNNCEHFVTWCRTGRPSSRQVQCVVDLLLRGIQGVLRNPVL